MSEQPTAEPVLNTEPELDTATEPRASSSNDLIVEPNTDPDGADQLVSQLQESINNLNLTEIEIEPESVLITPVYTGRYAWADRLVDRMQLSTDDYNKLKAYVLATGANTITATLCSDIALSAIIITLLASAHVIIATIPGLEFDP